MILIIAIIVYYTSLFPDIFDSIPLVLGLHHFQPGIEFMSAGRAIDAIRLDDEFVGTDSHASAIGTASQMHSFIVHGFVSGSAKAIDRPSIE